MAKVALILEDNGPHKVEMIKRLKNVVAAGIAEISTAIDKGEPLFVRRLFDRQDAGFPARLLAFLKWLESQSLHYKAVQVLDHEKYEPNKCSQYYAVNADRLRMIIATRNSSLNQQRQVARLQEDDD